MELERRPLWSFPLEVLDLITASLEATQILLLWLSGDKTLHSKLEVGGITSFEWRPSPVWRIPSFLSRLVRLRDVELCPGPKSLESIQSWQKGILELPPTVTSLRFYFESMDKALMLHDRYLPLELDDSQLATPIVQGLLAVDDDPILRRLVDLSVLFPRLHTLILSGILWKWCEIDYLSLPTTLTKLDLRNGSSMDDKFIPFLPSGLLWLAYSNPRHTLTSMIASMLPSGLKTLIMSGDHSVGPGVLQVLPRTLEDLDCPLDYISMPDFIGLPPLITSLDFAYELHEADTFGFAQCNDLLVQIFRRLGKLRALTLYGIHVFVSSVLRALSPTITSLSIMSDIATYHQPDTGDSSGWPTNTAPQLSSLDPLPLELFTPSTFFDNVTTEDCHFHPQDWPPNLASFSSSSSRVSSSLLESLPRSLTELHLCSLEFVNVTPKDLSEGIQARILSAWKYILVMVGRYHLPSLKRFSIGRISEVSTSEVFADNLQPELEYLNIECTSSLGRDFWPILPGTLSALVCYSQSSLLDLHLLPRTLTFLELISFSYSNSPSISLSTDCFKDLPRSLKTLHISWSISKSRLEDWAKLPPGLSSLQVCLDSSHFDSFLPLLPRGLTSLELRGSMTCQWDLNTMKELPRGLVNLKIHFDKFPSLEDHHFAMLPQSLTDVAIYNSPYRIWLPDVVGAQKGVWFKGR